MSDRATKTTGSAAGSSAIWGYLHPAVCSAILIPFFALGENGPLVLAATTGLVVLAVGVALWRRLRQAGETDASAVVFAAAAGLCWSVLPATLYASSAASGRVVLLCATIAAPTAALLIGRERAARAAFVAPVLVGGAWGILGGDEIETPLFLLMLLAAGVMVLAARRDPDEARDHGPVERKQGRGLEDDLVDLLLEARDGGSGDWRWEFDDRLRLGGDLDRFANATGLARDTLPGVPLTRLLVDGAGTEALLTAVAAREPLREQMVEVRLPGGGTAWWRLTGTAIHDADARFVGYRGLGTDISVLREAQARIAHLATHDALTGLANRTTFQALAARACAAVAEKGGAPHALLMLDLDGFKQVNDSLGHGVGDELLAAVAATLLRCVPPSAIVARLGGDEFAILLAVSARGAEVLASAITRAVAAPFALGEHEARISVSIGIALAPAHGTDVRDLAYKADLALYRAKEGGDGHLRFQESFALEIAERNRLETDIRSALERDELRLHYQPLLDPVEGRVVSCEALMRWRSPTRGDVPPSVFIPAAERGNLILAIGRLALEQACRDAVTWPLPAAVAVNISSQHLRSAEFKVDVLRALKISGLPPARLEIEVTESVFLDKSAASVEAMTWLRERGIKVALDDFGTGFSSLSYLLDFPVDKIKIDRAFVAGLLSSAKSQAVVDAILTLARRLGIRVVAEGVETAEQALALKLRRCDDLQGYLISRAQPPEEIARLLVALPGMVRVKVPALLESSFAAALAMKRSA